MGERYVQVIFPNGDETSSRRKSDGVWTIDRYVDEFDATNKGLTRSVHYGPGTFGHVDLYRREYIDRASGLAPSTVGTSYWD